MVQARDLSYHFVSHLVLPHVQAFQPLTPQDVFITANSYTYASEWHDLGLTDYWSWFNHCRHNWDEDEAIACRWEGESNLSPDSLAVRPDWPAHEKRADEYNRLREAHPDLMHDDILKRMTTWGDEEVVLEAMLQVRSIQTSTHPCLAWCLVCC